MNIKTYNPKGYSFEFTIVGATDAEIAALDKLWERNNFSAAFWAEKVQMHIDKDPRVARIGGVQYFIGPEQKGPDKFKGMGGRGYTIKFHDGREVITHNLWHNGEVPAELKDILPDNAVFAGGTL